ncbi:MAG: thioredoxin fold domain-containing protein [Actinobacteria bacterium]|nr:thioredoxin fold domain-containing protein [Actinomycetota bacterium]
MANNTLVRVVILVAVVVVAIILVYPKISSVPQQAVQNSAVGTTSQTLSPGERALGVGLKSGRPTMILFHSNSCIPCKEMSAIVAQISPEFTGRANFVDILVDDQAEAGLIAKFGVNSIPTSVFFNKTGKHVGTNVGVVEKDKLIDLLNSLEK